MKNWSNKRGRGGSNHRNTEGLQVNKVSESMMSNKRGREGSRGKK
jgi:hypothetical protein